MAEVKWIKLMIDVFDNRKIRHLRKLPEGNNIVLIWIMLLTIAGRCNAGGAIFITETIPYTTKMLAGELGFKESTVKRALEELIRFGMLIREGDKLLVNGWDKHQNTDGMEKIREQNRKRKQRQRERQNIAEECMSHQMSRDMSREVTQQNKKEEKEEEKDINTNSASDNAPSKKDISDFFESVWKLYPNKKGKGQVSDSKKKKLYEIGYDEMSRVIKRYIDDLAKEEWRKPQNGSTFFNSGYVDYLDANYNPLPAKPQKNSNNRFLNAPERKYDMGELERMLMEQNNFVPETEPEFLAEAEKALAEMEK